MSQRAILFRSSLLPVLRQRFLSTTYICGVSLRCYLNPTNSLWKSSSHEIFHSTSSICLKYREFHLYHRLCEDVIEVEGPAFAESITEGDINWLKQKGDFVSADELVAEIETDKTSVEVPSPKSGQIVELLVENGSKVVAHQKLFKLSVGGGDSSAAAPEAETTKKPEAKAKPETSNDPPKKTDLTPPTTKKPLSGQNVIEVEGPAFAESISEGDINWLKQKGDFVSADEIVAEIETDKTSVEVPCPQSGQIVELLVESGSKVVAHQKLFKLSVGGGDSSAAAPEVETIKKPKVKAKPEAPEDLPKKTDLPPPTTKKPLSAEIPKSLPYVPQPPSAPISSHPVSSIPLTSTGISPKPLPHVPQPPSSKTGSQPVSFIPLVSTGVSTEKAITGMRTETRVKMNRMRQRIAQRLKDAQNTYAMLTTFNEIDMSNVMQMRSKHQSAFMKKHGIKLGLMSPFIRASAYALQKLPVVNAVIEEGEIIYRHYVDISIAVASPRGLVVPVLRSVESMDYSTIERTINELGLKARDNKLAIEEMEGGTFTISNGGVFGSMFGTPIVNPPQSAILGMHGIFERPVAVSGKVEIHPMMTVALTYDHRLIDGREAVTFLKSIKEVIEDPTVMLLSL